MIDNASITLKFLGIEENKPACSQRNKKKDAIFWFQSSALRQNECSGLRHRNWILRKKLHKQKVGDSNN
jgi:hypothetical protein